MDDDVRLGRLIPGLPVCGVEGSKIGTLAHVHQQVATDAGAEPDVAATPAVGDKVVEVKTGLFGLGKHLYIPTTAIETVTDDHVILKQPRDEVDTSEWTRPPANLRQVI